MHSIQFQPHLWRGLITILLYGIELIASAILKQLCKCGASYAHTPSDTNRFDLPSRYQTPDSAL